MAHIAHIGRLKMKDRKMIDIKDRPTRLENGGTNFQGRKMQNWKMRDRKMWDRKMQDGKMRDQFHYVK